MKLKLIVLLSIITAFGFVQRTTLCGAVHSGTLPVSGAVVRVQGAANYAITDENGAFTLSVPFSLEALHITASAPGYYNTVRIASPPTALVLDLERHSTLDYADYAFIDPLAETAGACINCHAGNETLPVEEWLADAHSQSTVNPRFLSMYNGTTLDGKSGALTTSDYDAAKGIDVLEANPDTGFRLDYPDSAGSCATCHAPIAALKDPYNADPNKAAGITCDFCHKVSGVRLTPPLSGVLSMDFLRPPPGEQIFLGPMDDTPGDDVYSPLYDQSEYCAPCHSGSFWDVPIYNSFGEWRESPYSDPQTGQTCQDCHMPRRGVTTFVNSKVTQYVPERDPQTIFSHRMPGAADVDLLQNTAALTLEARRDGDTLLVTVSVTNSGAGHHIPTDNPLRNLILLVETRDNNGQTLTLIEGSIVPAAGGVGDPAEGFYAGQPGVLYAKILADSFTGETPTFAYWRKTRLVSDHRIAALDTDTTTYRFRLDESEVTVSARLIFRRAFIDLMNSKGWDTPDIVMEQETVTVR